jgi:hypothetical protein
VNLKPCKIDKLHTYLSHKYVYNKVLAPGERKGGKRKVKFRERRGQGKYDLAQACDLVMLALCS